MKTLVRFLQNLFFVTFFIGGAALLISAAVGFVAVGVHVGGLWGGAVGLVTFLILFISVVLTVCGGD